MNRPYCISELKDIDNDLKAKYRLSDIFAEHIPCMHRYRVKRGGRKERSIKDFGCTGGIDDMTCSICFKLRTSDDAPANAPANAPAIDGSSHQSDHPPTNLYGLPTIKSSYREDELVEFCTNDGILFDIGFLKRKEDFYKWLYRHDY